MTHINTALTEKLAKLTDGLFWMSESDYPWQVFAWETPGPINHNQLLQLTHHPADTPIAEVGLDEFFAPSLVAQDWYGEAESAMINRYRELVYYLNYNLSDIKVYRVGKPPNIYVYIIGTTRDDNLAGIVTQSVET